MTGEEKSRRSRKSNADPARSLSGAAKNAYLRRAIREADAVSPEGRDQLTQRLQKDIAQVTLSTTKPLAEPAATAPAIAAAMPAFDPFSPNVVVVMRTKGRAEAMAALETIPSADHLKLLAREQQLTIDFALTAPPQIRVAIVASAERRIANRRAAAS